MVDETTADRKRLDLYELCVREPLVRQGETIRRKRDWRVRLVQQGSDEAVNVGWDE